MFPVVVGDKLKTSMCWAKAVALKEKKAQVKVDPFSSSDNVVLTKMSPVVCHIFMDINWIIKHPIYTQIITQGN